MPRKVHIVATLTSCADKLHPSGHTRGRQQEKMVEMMQLKSASPFLVRPHAPGAAAQHKESQVRRTSLGHADAEPRPGHADAEPRDTFITCAHLHTVAPAMLQGPHCRICHLGGHLNSAQGSEEKGQRAYGESHACMHVRMSRGGEKT
jgi:hypothetical protein